METIPQIGDEMRNQGGNSTPKWRRNEKSGWKQCTAKEKGRPNQFSTDLEAPPYPLFKLSFFLPSPVRAPAFRKFPVLGRSPTPYARPNPPLQSRRFFV